MHTSLTRHFEGIKFRERNAGAKIDAHMREEGFTVEAGVNIQTGFIYGGNGFNCGTWMDKMGSCDRVGNKGIPATPRDGCAIELTALCAAVLEFLDNAYKKKWFSFDGVEKADSRGKFLAIKSSSR